MTIIYILIKNNKVIYVGKTNNINNRINKHKLKFGENTELSEIDIVENEVCMFWEKHYISLYKSWGFELENKNNGGGGAVILNKETKQKISDAKKGKPTKAKGKPKPWLPLKKGWKEKISKSNKGHQVSIQTRQKISDSRKGKKFSKETKQKISDAKKGKPNISLVGFKHTDVTKEKKRKAMLGNSNKPKKIVNQYNLRGDLINVYPSYTEALKQTGIKMTEALRGKVKTAGGFIWKYNNE